MVHQGQNEKIKRNIELLRAGLTSEKQANFKADICVLEAYNPSPKNRVITEYELLGALVNKDSKEVGKLKWLAFGNILNSKNHPKQFGNGQGQSLSKISKIVDH